MSVPRTRKPKRKKSILERISPEEFIRKANYLNFACTVRTLKSEFGFGDKRLAKFIESYMALLSELYDGRSTVNEVIQDCKVLTGIDVKALLDNLEKK